MKRQSLPSAKPMMNTLYRNGVARVAYILIGLILALGFSPLEAQGRTPLPPVPPVTDPPGTELGPSATITFADATQIQTQSIGGRFLLIGLHPGEVIDFVMEFPASLMGNSVAAQPLDGGTIIAALLYSERNTRPRPIRFQVGGQPGLYRILITAGASRSMLHFWVADARHPQNNRPVLNPGH
jgi:hypothetical protein